LLSDQEKDSKKWGVMRIPTLEKGSCVLTVCRGRNTLSHTILHSFLQRSTPLRVSERDLVPRPRLAVPARSGPSRRGSTGTSARGLHLDL